MAETKTVPSYLLCLCERSPLHTNLAFLFTYPTWKFNHTSIVFFLTYVFFCTLQQQQLSPGHRRTPQLTLVSVRMQVVVLCLHRPHALEVFRKEKWLPTVAKWTSNHDGTVSKSDSHYAAKCSVVLTGLEQSLKKLEVASLRFVDFNSHIVDLHRVTQAKYAKLESPEDIIYLLSQILQWVSCFEVVL